VGRYKLAKLALLDMDEIADYIAQDNLDAALALLIRLRQRCVSLSEHPGAGRQCEHIGENVRSATEGNYMLRFQPS